MRQVEGAYFELSGPPEPVVIFFFNDTATTEIYPLSLHDALPISAEAFIVAISVTEPGAVVLDAPIDIEDVYLPVVLPITSIAAAHQLPWVAKISPIPFSA